MTSTIDSPPATREDLDWFQARRERWRSKPRPALLKLPPASAKIGKPETLLKAIEDMQTSSPKRTKSFSPTRKSPPSSFSTPTQQRPFHTTTTTKTTASSPSSAFRSPKQTSSETISPFGKISACSPMSAKPFGGLAKAPVSNSNPFGGGGASAAAYPPMSSKTPTPFGASAATQAKATSKSTASFPPMPTKAPTPFGTQAKAAAAPKASFASFPPMSTEAPTPFGAQPNAPKASSAAFPPMSTKAPTPFGTQAKATAPKSAATSAAFPPMSTKAPTPFGGATTAQKGTPAARTATFPPMSSKAPTPFGAAANFPPMSSKAPTPFGKSAFGASSSVPKVSLAPKPSVASSSYPPMASKTPTPFGSAKTRTAESSSTDYRSRLITFYKKHNPSKVDTVDATLEKYKGKEEELFKKLEDKYEGTFPLPSGEGPQCYLEFSVDGEKAGRVAVKLYQDKVPLASDNFKCLCTGEKGMGRSGKPLCYQNSKIHRIVPGFCVQMGDFTKGNGTGGESIYPPNSEHGDAWGKFKNESFMRHSKPGLLSMANSGKDTNSSQVFFTLRPVSNLDGKHVVFGEVVAGMDVIEKLGKLETNAEQNPVKTVTITDCGEIVDGKDVPCKIPESKPFGLTGSGFGKSATSSPFGKPGQSPFGAVTPAAAPFGGGFGLSKGSAPSSGAFAFGKSPAPSFGASSTTTANASPFSFTAQNADATSSSPSSTFSCSNSNAGPAFGSSNASQA